MACLQIRLCQEGFGDPHCTARGRNTFERPEGYTDDVWRDAIRDFGRLDWGLHHEVIDLLMSAGAEVNALDFEGRTPYMTAVQSLGFDKLGLDRLIQLLQFGADPTLRDFGGRTARDIFVRGPWKLDAWTERVQAILEWSEKNTIEHVDPISGEISQRIPFDCDLREQFSVKPDFDERIDGLPKLW